MFLPNCSHQIVAELMNYRVGIVAAEMNKLSQTWMQQLIPCIFLLIWHFPRDLRNAFSLYVVVLFYDIVEYVIGSLDVTFAEGIIAVVCELHGLVALS